MGQDTKLQQRAAAVATATFLALLATALYTVLYHASASGVRDFLSKPLPAGTAPPTYTGLAAVDTLLNNAVALFHAGFRHSRYAAHFLVGLAPGVLAYVVEYSRTGSLGAGAAMGVGMAFQVGTTSVVMPLAWLALVLHSTRAQGRGEIQPPMTRAQAEAAVGGVLLGYVLPTLLMLALENDGVTALWQIFPLFVWGAQIGWLRYTQRTGRVHSDSQSGSGLPVLQAGFALLALLSFAQHLRVLFSVSSLSPKAFIDWLPSIRTPTPGTLTLPAAAVHLLQWTSICCYAAIFAGAFFLGDLESPAALGLLAPVVSPGAVIALVWMRREARLEKAARAREATGTSGDVTGEKKKQ